MCLPFALEDYAWVNSCCRSGTAVFTGSVAVTRPFVSDVSLTLHITRELDELKQSTATTSEVKKLKDQFSNEMKELKDQNNSFVVEEVGSCRGEVSRQYYRESRGEVAVK